MRKRDRPFSVSPEMNGNDTTAKLIGQRTTFLQARDGKAATPVDVKELRWPDAMQFMRMLSEQIGLFTGQNELGQPVFDLSRLKEAIPAAGNLAEFLVQRATGLSAETIAVLTASEFLELLAEAMEVNLSEELLGKFQRVARVAARTFGAPSSNFPEPSTS